MTAKRFPPIRAVGLGVDMHASGILVPNYLTNIGNRVASLRVSVVSPLQQRTRERRTIDRQVGEPPIH